MSSGALGSTTEAQRTRPSKNEAGSCKSLKTFNSSRYPCTVGANLSRSTRDPTPMSLRRNFPMRKCLGTTLLVLPPLVASLILAPGCRGLPTPDQDQADAADVSPTDSATDMPTADATDNSSDDAGSPDMAWSCRSSCPSCGTDEICVNPSTALSDFEPSCLKRCRVSDDCSSGMRCAIFFGTPDVGPFCTSTTLPRGCRTAPPGWHCDFAGEYCRDANTLSRQYSSPSNFTCGYERIACPNGCLTLSISPPRGRCQ